MFRENFETFSPVTLPVLPKRTDLETHPTRRTTTFFARLRAAVARWAEGRKRLQADRAYRDLPDHLLRDIGVDRSDIAGTDLGPLIKTRTSV